MTTAWSSEATEISTFEKNTSWVSGSLGFLVSSSWWKDWVQYSGYTGPGAATVSTQLQFSGGGGPRPGPIANADLLPSDQDACATPPSGTAVAPDQTPLRPGLVEQQDFVVVSTASWQRLHSLYGGGPAIARRVVVDAAPGPAARPGERWSRIALYPLKVEVHYTGGGKAAAESKVLTIEPEASLATLKARACAAMQVKDEDVTLWDYTGRNLVRSLEAPQPGELDDEAAASTGAGAAATGVKNSASTSTFATAAAGTAPAPGAEESPTGPEAAAGSSAGGAPGAGSSMDVDKPAAVEAPATAEATVMAAEGAVAEAATAGSSGGAGTGAGAGSGGSGYMARSLREVPLQDNHVVFLRRKNAPSSDSEDGDDACGSDNDTGVPASRKTVGKKAAGAAGSSGARLPASEAAATAALRRASAAAASGSRSDAGSGGGTAPAAPARASGGGGSGQLGSRFGQRALGAWDDNVMLREGQLPGLAGLSNLGNTCFMNSSLQCLAHAVPLMTSFLGGTYMRDLNRTNPLGMKGELAEAFGSLMTQLWRGGVSAVTPRAFKAKIGRFAPQFSGYAQHDSQEFLAFLLDGLHEDTNRIRNKPYIEEKDQPGRPDEVVAAEAWANYRARNDSLVVDHFQGLFKSTVDCPKCSFNSVKFDPFMYLSLPLPESRRRVFEVVLVRMDGSQLPCRMALEMASGATVADLLRATAKVAELPAEVQASPQAHLLAARPLRCSPGNMYDPLKVLDDTRMRLADALDSHSGRARSVPAEPGFVVYYYPDAASGPTAEGMKPVVVHFRRMVFWKNGEGGGTKHFCGAPLVLFFPADQPPYDPEQLVDHSAGASLLAPRWEVQERCPLIEALVQVLRPIQKQPLPPPAQKQQQQQGQAQDAPGEVQAEAAAAEPADGDAGAALAPAELPSAACVDPLPVVSAAAEAAALLGGSAGAAAAADAAAVAAAGPMEEDEPAATRPPAAAASVSDGAAAAEAAGELRPGTPSREGEPAGSVATVGEGGDAGPDGAASLGRRRSSGEVMEGLEPIVGPGPGPEQGGGGAGDASMPGTPQPAASGAMEDDVLAAAPSPLPAVILAGPPAGGDGVMEEGRRDGVQPFNMWAAQEAAAAAAPPPPPPPADLPAHGLDVSLWLAGEDCQSSHNVIDPKHTRFFVLHFFTRGVPLPTSLAPPARPSVLYAAELMDTPEEHCSLREHRRRATAGAQPVSLADCMTTFLEPERLDENDAWYCPRCKSHVCADKKLDLWSLPEVLVVHLKRFSYTRYSRNKLDTRVDFPLHGLDLGPYVLRQQAVPPLYDLFAVSNHYGSLGGGHYTAYAKLPSPPPGADPSAEAAAEGGEGSAGAGTAERWYCFDDSHVSEVEPEAVRSPAAYVLFYRRRAEAAADPPVLADMLEMLREQRTAAQASMDAQVDGPVRDAGSPDSGSDRHPHQGRDQGRPLGPVSLAAAAEAAKAARGSSSQGAQDAGEDMEVSGQREPAFTAMRRDSGPGAVSHPRTSAGSGGGGAGQAYEQSDYADIALAAPSSPTPMSVGNTRGDGSGSFGTPPRRSEGLHSHGRGGGVPVYNPDDYEDIALGGDVGGGSGVGCGLGADDGGVMDGLPGTPAEPDVNNLDLSNLYDDADAIRRRDSGSDMATSAGGNDQEDVEVEDDGAGAGQHFGARRGGGGARRAGAGSDDDAGSDPGSGGGDGGGLGAHGLSLMSTSPA